MEVVGDDFWVDAKEVLVEIDRALIVFQRLQVFHIADVLRDKGVLVAGQAKGVLDLGPAGQDLFGLEGQLDRERCIASRATDGLRLSTGSRDMPIRICSTSWAAK